MNKLTSSALKNGFLGFGIVFSVLTTLLFVPLASAQDSAVVELRDTVTGNQEQPKVLYIVPWRAANDDTILYAAPTTKLQLDVFEHIERPEHLRKMHYLNQLTAPEKSHD